MHLLTNQIEASCKTASVCGHKNFESTVAVNRMEDCEVWSVDVRVRCAGCGAVVRFIGMDTGAGGGKPLCSLWADEARLPCALDLPPEVWDEDGGPLSEEAREAVGKSMARQLDAGPCFTLRRSPDVPS